MKQFRYTVQTQTVMFGAGYVAMLADATDAYGWPRMMLCTSRSLVADGTAAVVKKTLEQRLVAVYGEVAPHVQESQVAAALALAQEHDIDAVIGLGGGSPIGLAKAVSFGMETTGTDQPRVPSIAVPTTYAGSEMTPVFGVTRVMEDGSTRKATVKDPRITPRLAVYDPQLTLNTPPSLTATSGVNALAHCIEAVYSISRNPLSTAAALSGLRYIANALLRCHRNGSDVAARTEMLIGAHLGGACLSTVAMGLHHGTCHVLGGSAGVPHGIANSIILPHAIRYNLRVATPMLAEAAEAMGISRSGRSDEALGEAAAQFVHELVSQMGVPQRLRDVGVTEEGLPRLAEDMLKSEAVRNNPEPVTSAEQALSFLRSAW